MAEKPVMVRESIGESEYRKISEAVIEEFRARKSRRKDLEKKWAEVDRQLRMEPERSHKQDAAGKIIKGKEWLPEVELPFQAQTLEMLTADARRLKFPRNRDWFTARAALTPQYMEAWKGAGSPILGEKSQNTIEVTQDDADRLAQAALSYFHSQYDFRANVDQIDADAFKYTFGVGRLRAVNKSIMNLSALRDSKPEIIPVLIPRSAKSVYLDDTQHALMHEGVRLGPNIIQEKTIKLADLQAAAKDDDSYIRSQIGALKADKDGNVQLIELEGDLVVDVGDKVIIEKNIVVTAALGSGTGESKTTHGLVRVKNGEGFSTYFVHQYQLDSTDSAYGSSPLLKGMPIARIMAQTMNRMLESGMLKNGPPIGYNRDDPAFALTGGPNIEPYAKWQTTDPLNVYDEVGGDPSALFNIFQGLVAMYTDVTGVNPARLGALTKSHTTAFAKDAELARGESRTVDFTNATLEGPMTRLLDLEYRMGLKHWKNRPIYIDAWKEFAEIKKGHLPDIVKFVAIGAGAPAEEQARFAAKFESAQAAIQLDGFSVQQGNQPTIDVPALIKSILADGGWSDVSEITLDQENAAGNVAEQGQLSGIVTGDADPMPI